jgi:uncharacterized protein
LLKFNELCTRYFLNFTGGLSDMEAFEQREQVTLESSKLKVFAILHLPKPSHLSQNKFPAVLLCHGFGGNKSGKFRLFVRIAEQLAKCGIAALRLDFRGAGDSEGDFKDTTIQSQLEDAQIAFEYLKNHPLIDTKRIGILGRSLGGMISYATATRFPDVKSVALWAPVFDGKPWLEKKIAEKPAEPKFRSIQFDKALNSYTFLGTPLSAAFIREFFSFNGENELQKLSHIPLLLIFGEKDPVVEKYHQDQYEAIRRHASAYTKKLVLPLSDHDFSVPDEQKILLQETVDWFQKHL